jgi:hypothetical protein
MGSCCRISATGQDIDVCDAKFIESEFEHQKIALSADTIGTVPPLALDRKNALSAGSDEGGDNWAVIATLIECCKLNNINPHERLAKLANGHTANHVSEVMLWTAVSRKHRYTNDLDYGEDGLQA